MSVASKTTMTLKQSLGLLSRLGPPVMSFDTKGGFKNLKSNKKYLHIAIDHMSGLWLQKVRKNVICKSQCELYMHSSSLAIDNNFLKMQENKPSNLSFGVDFLPNILCRFN